MLDAQEALGVGHGCEAVQERDAGVGCRRDPVERGAEDVADGAFEAPHLTMELLSVRDGRRVSVRNGRAEAVGGREEP
jgi:hypothetical protein